MQRQLGSTGEAALREVRYLDHLIPSGFTLGGRPFRVFTFDSFHDGKVLLHRVRLASCTVTMSFQNVYAVDSVDRAREETGLRRRKFPRGGLQTKIILHGVRNILLPDVPSGNLLYHCSNLFRENGGYRLAIQVWGRREYGVLSISFAEIDVEDIAPNIAKYPPVGTEVARHPGYAKESPRYYAELRHAALGRFGSQNRQV